MSGPTLVIVDMQYFFEDTAGRCLDGVLKEIELAKERGAPIVILEYALDAGEETFKEIHDAIGGYKLVTTALKWNDGGGKELWRAIAKKGWDHSHLRFTGVNRCYCVYATIRQYVCECRGRGVDHKLEIAIDATWCNNPADGRELYTTRQGSNWKVIRTEDVIKPHRHPSYKNRHKLPRNQRAVG